MHGKQAGNGFGSCGRGYYIKGQFVWTLKVFASWIGNKELLQQGQ
jgi:hypothetical protein